jgi:ribosome-binding factor A
LCVGISHNKSVVTVQRAFRAKYAKVFVTPLPPDLADLKARIIAAVKNIDAPMLTRLCGKNLNIVSMCAVSHVVHTSNISSCEKKIIRLFLWL